MKDKKDELRRVANPSLLKKLPLIFLGKALAFLARRPKLRLLVVNTTTKLGFFAPFVKVYGGLNERKNQQITETGFWGVGQPYSTTPKKPSDLSPWGKEIFDALPDTTTKSEN